jgi:membrane protein implicated in regulation of membrane protease activity
MLGRDRVEQGGAVGLARAESLGLGLGLDRRRCGARRALVAAFLPVTSGTTAAAAATLTIAGTTVAVAAATLTIAGTTVAVAAATLTIAGTTVAIAAATLTIAGTTVAIAAISAITALTAAASRALTRAGASQGGGDEGCVGRTGAADLEPVRIGTRRSGWRDRNDAQAVEVGVDLGSQHVADLGAAREDGGVECAPGLAGAGGPPRP